MLFPRACTDLTCFGRGYRMPSITVHLSIALKLVDQWSRRCEMPESARLLTFGFVCLGMALTPGPNMVYLISRSICQGRTAGLISLSGVALGFACCWLCHTRMTPWALAAHSICSGSPSRQSSQGGVRRSRCASRLPTAHANYSQLGSSRIC